MRMRERLMVVLDCCSVVLSISFDLFTAVNQTTHLKVLVKPGGASSRCLVLGSVSFVVCDYT